MATTRKVDVIRHRREHTLDSVFLFADRRSAGEVLARDLASFAEDDAVVVGLGRGGLVVAAAVARELGLPLGAVDLDGQLHRGRAVPSLAGHAVLLVDDGLATGATMRAAARWAESRGARRVVATAPVGARDTVTRLASEVDAVVCPHPVDDLISVGLWYEDFGQVDDDEVAALLAGPSAVPSVSHR